MYAGSRFWKKSMGLKSAPRSPTYQSFSRHSLDQTLGFVFGAFKCSTVIIILDDTLECRGISASPSALGGAEPGQMRP